MTPTVMRTNVGIFCAVCTQALYNEHTHLLEHDEKATITSCKWN